MEPRRPYDENQIAALAPRMDAEIATKQAMEERLSRPLAPLPLDLHRDREGVIVHTLPEAAPAINGLRGVILGWRIDRANEIAETANRRKGVVRNVGEAIDTGTNEQHGPAAKAGWVGYHKREIGVRGSERDPLRPNIYRPVTRSERRATRRLEKQITKKRVHDGNRRWLERSYDSPMIEDPDNRIYERTPGIRLTKNLPLPFLSSETKHLGKIDRGERKHFRTVGKARSKFDRITASEDFAGRFWQSRGRRARNRTERLLGKAERLSEKTS